MGAKDNSKRENESIEKSPSKVGLYCRPRYRLRWFNSKPAFLIIIWMILLTFASYSLIFNTQLVPMHSDDSKAFKYFIQGFPYLGILAAPVAGWLADYRLGTYKVTKIGMCLLFFSTVCSCLLHQLSDYIAVGSSLMTAFVLVSGLIGASGSAFLLVTLFTLGFDQLANASSSEITSYISWFACAFSAGVFACNAMLNIPKACMDNSIDYFRVLQLVPVAAVSIVLITDSLLADRLLMIETPSPQSLKMILGVLKFAVKHKAPLNRSSLTYWEEEIPSRVDLGKSRYGGPYSTEEVEDVKVILRLIVISIPFSILAISFNLQKDSPLFSHLHIDDVCLASIYKDVVDSVSLSAVIVIVVYEVFIFPIISHLLPSILTRFGLVSFACLVLNINHFCLSIGKSLDPSISWNWLVHLQAFLSGVLRALWVPAGIEFYFAQSPSKMKGLMIGGVLFLTFLFNLFYIFVDAAQNPVGAELIIPYSAISAVLNLFSLVLFCFLVRWYKPRVRDDVVTPHQWAEEAFERYISSSSQLNSSSNPQDILEGPEFANSRWIQDEYNKLLQDIDMK